MTQSKKLLKTYKTPAPVNHAVISPIFNHVLCAGGQEARDVALKVGGVLLGVCVHPQYSCVDVWAHLYSSVYRYTGRIHAQNAWHRLLTRVSPTPRMSCVSSCMSSQASKDGNFEIKFYHLIDETLFGLVRGHFGTVNTAAIHPDGGSFASGGEDGFIRLHHFDPAYHRLENKQYNKLIRSAGRKKSKK